MIALLPALGAALFAAASAALGCLSGARRAALTETLDGGSKHALQRYIDGESAIESRWLVLRALGIGTTALLFARQLPDNALGTVGAALLALVSYAVPSQIARVLVERTADRAAPFLLRALRPIELLAWPLSTPIVGVGNLVGRLVARAPPSPKVTETEVEIIVNEGEQNGSLAHDQSEMIRNVLDFGSLTAGELMVPRTHVIAFEVDMPASEVLQRVAETEHSRYPIYKTSIENVLGVLHVKDLLSRMARDGLNDVKLVELVRRPIVFVPESQPASSVLKDMRARHQHLAVVIDEFGGMNGIVTLEDLVEEIVGDIRDEHDVEEPPIVDLGGGRLMVDASVSISDLSRYLNSDLPEDGDYNSLGGFIVSRFGRVPAPGAKVSTLGLDFVVREADERHVAKVEIVRKTPSPDSIAPSSSSRVTAA